MLINTRRGLVWVAGYNDQDDKYFKETFYDTFKKATIPTVVAFGIVCAVTVAFTYFNRPDSLLWLIIVLWCALLIGVLFVARHLKVELSKFEHAHEMYSYGQNRFELRLLFSLPVIADTRALRRHARQIDQYLASSSTIPPKLAGDDRVDESDQRLTEADLSHDQKMYIVAEARRMATILGHGGARFEAHVSGVFDSYQKWVCDQAQREERLIERRLAEANDSILKSMDLIMELHGSLARVQDRRRAHTTQ